MLLALSVVVALAGPASQVAAQDSPRVPRFYTPVDGLGEGINSSQDSIAHDGCDDDAIDYLYYDNSSHTDRDGNQYYPTQGMTIWPTLPGRVVFSGFVPDYGYTVVLRHWDYSKWDNIYYSVYAHLEEEGRPRVGHLLDLNTPVGGMDMTGSGGNHVVHLHFAVRSSNTVLSGTSALYCTADQQPFDPRPYMW
jgi:hypothetical protein